MEALSGLAGHVEETLRVNLQGLENAVDSPHSQLGEVGKRRPQVRRPDRGDTEYSFLPQFVSQQPAGVKASHAVADQVNRLVAECFDDVFAQPASPALDAGDRLHSRHEHPVSGRFQGLRNASEVRCQSQRPDANAGKPEEAVGQHDRGIETREYRLG